jgi:hypothetical protein
MSHQALVEGQAVRRGGAQKVLPKGVSAPLVSQGFVVSFWPVYSP